MNQRNRAQLRLMRDYEELQQDPPYVKLFEVSIKFIGN